MAENEKLTEMSNQEIDQAIMATQEEIQDKIKTEIPLIGERIPLNSLSDDFSGDDLFLEKLNHLTEIFKDIVKIRKVYQFLSETWIPGPINLSDLIRPDGNCFYTAFAFSLFETLIGQIGEVKRVKSLMKSTRDFLIDTLSYPDITVDDFYETGMNIRTYRRKFEC